MIRTVAVALAFASLASAPARATPVEVHTDVARATITVRNDRMAWSGPAPYSGDLPAGRYDLSISADGRRLAGHVLDIDRGVHLRSGRWSRTALSAVLPGAGQWRDDSWWSGAVTGVSAALLFGRSIYFNVQAGSRRDESDVDPDLVPETDDLVRLRWDIEVFEETRDDYLMLAGVFYAGNVLDAMVRRGAVNFRETSPGVATANYEPSGVAHTMLLSALWPGLGQVRQGRVGRARVWNVMLLGTAYFWAEAQNLVEAARADREVFSAITDPAEPGYYETLARLESDVDEQKAVARSAAYVALALWAYNIGDAGLVARSAIADSGEMVRNEEQSSGWSLSPGLVGSSAGLVLAHKF